MNNPFSMKNLLPAFILLCSLPVWAQTTPGRPFVLGGSLGFEPQLIGIQTLDGLEPARTAVLSERPAPGMSIGGFVRWQLWSGFAIQQELSLAFARNPVLFRPDGRVHYHFTTLELPLHFVWTNRAKGQFPLRGSFSFGGRLGWNLAPQPTDWLHLVRERAALDIGLGVEMHKGKWRFQPEFIYSYGLNNLHDFSNSRYDWLVGSVVWDKLTLRLLLWQGTF